MLYNNKSRKFANNKVIFKPSLSKSDAHKININVNENFFKSIKVISIFNDLDSQTPVGFKRALIIHNASLN